MDFRILATFVFALFTLFVQAKGECPHPRFRDKHYIPAMQTTLNGVYTKSLIRYQQASPPIRDWWYGPPSTSNTVVVHPYGWASVSAGAVAAYNTHMRDLINQGKLNENDQLCTHQAAGSWLYTCRSVGTANPTCGVVGQCATYHLASNGVAEPAINPATGRHAGSATTWGNTSGHLYFQEYFMIGKCV